MALVGVPRMTECPCLKHISSSQYLRHGILYFYISKPFLFVAVLLENLFFSQASSNYSLA
jgi:hypothetical protein